MAEDKVRIVVETLKSFTKRFKKFPTLEWLVRYTDIPEVEVENILKYLEDRQVIKKNNRPYEVIKKRTEDRFAISKPIKVEPKSRKRRIVKSKENRLDKIISSAIISSYRIVSAMIGLICIVVSIYFTYIFLKTHMLPLVALGLSVTIVSLMVISYNVRNFFRKKREDVKDEKQRKKLVAVFTAVWLISLSYSITSSIFVQAINFMDKEQIGIEVSSNTTNANKLLLDDYSKRIKDLKIDIKSSRKERDKLHEFLEKVEEFDSEEYKKINRKIDEKDWYLEKLIKKLVKLETKKEDILIDSPEVLENEEFNFYVWLSQALGNIINPLLIQFILSVFPAVLIDFGGPLALYIALFLRQKGIEEV